MRRSPMTLLLIIVSLSALTETAVAQPATPPADWSFEPNVVGERLGGWVTGAGDVNGDGYDDILVSAPESSGSWVREGKVYLFLGSPSGPGAIPDRTWTGSEPYAALAAYAAAGDLDGDGFDEVLLSDGRLYRGSAGGPVSAPVPTAIRGRLVAGDINADGYGDLVAASPGRLDVFLGSPAGPPVTPSQSIVMD